MKIAGRVMDKAQVADRRALFAGLQAACMALIDTRDPTVEDPLQAAYERIEKALDVGAPYGSPEHLASLEQEEARHG